MSALQLPASTQERSKERLGPRGKPENHGSAGSQGAHRGAATTFGSDTCRRCLGGAGGLNQPSPRGLKCCLLIRRVPSGPDRRLVGQEWAYWATFQAIWWAKVGRHATLLKVVPLLPFKAKVVGHCYATVARLYPYLAASGQDASGRELDLRWRVPSLVGRAQAQPPRQGKGASLAMGQSHR